MFGKGIEIPVRMQQVIPIFDAPGCNYRVDCFADGKTPPAQGAKILCGLNGYFLPTQLDHDQRGQHLSGDIEVPIIVKTLKHLCQDQVAN